MTTSLLASFLTNKVIIFASLGLGALLLLILAVVVILYVAERHARDNEIALLIGEKSTENKK